VFGEIVYDAAMAKTEPALESSRNCWRIEQADKATVIIDAEDYFHRAREAMLGARDQLLLVGWDFDGRIKLVYDHEDEGPAQVGPFIEWLVRKSPSLSVYLLRWDTGALKSLFRGNTALTLLRWVRDRQIHVKLDGHHPPAGSHHQKIVVVDDCLAFCGGIDMTGDRWDTRDHDDVEPRRIEPDGTPYGPWHDATTALSGPVAKALGELCRERWARAGGGELPEPSPRDACWPGDLDVDFTDCSVAISRTMPEMPDTPPVFEIEQLYIDLIARAEHWIYAESQYFASHRVAKAIAARLEEDDGPEIVIINPVTAEGWLEPIAMDTARARIIEALRRHDRHDRLRLYHPMTRGGQPIYVHAKVTIIDGEILRVGSSNFNNRSMRIDSECDVTIDSTRSENAHCTDTVRAVAFNLLAEHLGTRAATVEASLAQTGSLIAAIERNNRVGQRHLKRYEMPELNGVEEALADNQILDPENPDEMVEVMQRKQLLRGLKSVRERPIAQPATLALLGVGIVAAAAGGLFLGRRKPRD